VLQHEVRGIAAIIWELLTDGHWVVGAFLLLFSILTPLTKRHSRFCDGVPFQGAQLQDRAIPAYDWQVVDGGCFRAGVILSLYALKSREATKSVPALVSIISSAIVC